MRPMQPGGYYPRANAATSGGYGNVNGGGFRYGSGQPYRPPAQQMMPQQKEAVLMAAGRLAAEYLVDRGDLPPGVLENRPPVPIPFRQGPPAPQHGRQQPAAPAPRAFHFQGRPPAPQQRHHQPGPRPFHFQGPQRPPAPQRQYPGPRPFQGGPVPFPRRPRPSPYCPCGSAPPKTGYAGQGAARPVVVSKKIEEDNAHSAPAGEASDSQPTAQLNAGRGPEQTNQPSSCSIGANADK